MANTTNFGWETPDDTDLVKDGAAAIRTLGSAIDTSMADLKGGTTGQILSKNSNTDMDFTWIPAPAVGSYTEISSTALSGTTINLTSIPNTYKKLILVIRDVYPLTDNANFRIRFNADTTANSVLTHMIGADTTSPTPATVNYGLLGNFIYATAEGMDNTSSDNLFILELEDYANSATFKTGECLSTVLDNGGSLRWLERATFTYLSTSAISQINLFFSTGDIAGGTAILYGVK